MAIVTRAALSRCGGILQPTRWAGAMDCIVGLANSTAKCGRPGCSPAACLALAGAWLVEHEVRLDGDGSALHSSESSGTGCSSTGLRTAHGGPPFGTWRA